MKSNFVLSLMAIAFLATASDLPADPPSHQDFRSQTFVRPSRALQSFQHEGYGSRYSHRSNYIVVPIYGGSYGYQPSSYYDSTIRNYGPSPFTGLDASRSLYSTPYRSSVYGYTTPIRPSSFSESTIPYGSYQYRAGGY